MTEYHQGSKDESIHFSVLVSGVTYARSKGMEERKIQKEPEDMEKNNKEFKEVEIRMTELTLTLSPLDKMSQSVW